MVARACGDRTTIDRRLVRSPTGAGEVDPSAGGFLVDTQFAEELVGIAYAEESVLASLCDRRQTSSRLADVRVPAIDETSRADGSRWGGTASYWLGEGAPATLSMPRFRNLAFSSKKLLAAVVVSKELLDDVPMLGAHMRRAFTAELGFRLDQAILAGDGAGKPVGITNSPALITVAKEAGQASATIVAENVANMWSRLPAPSRRRAVWFCNEDAESQLEKMATLVGTTAVATPTAAALYMPAGANGNEFATLKGRPIVVLEQCPTLGATGDIVLADMIHYVLIDGGVTPALSLDVKFTTDEAVFRFTLRCDGQSAFASPITPYNGSSARSPFVALAAR
jgi:HK97 family phage major capsid protein